MRITSLRPLLGIASVLAAASLGPAAVAQAAPAPITVSVEPVVGPKTVMAKIAPSAPGQPGRWELNYYYVLTNTSASTSVVVNDATLAIDATARKDVINTTIAPGTTRLFNTAGTFGGVLPAPSAATVSVTFARGFDPLTKPIDLALHASPTATGAYQFPLRSSDLPSDAYWGNFEATDATSHHHGDLPQHYAYDVLGYRYDAGANQWVTRTSTGAANLNDSYLAWDRPLLAIGDGTVVECRRSLADNTPGTMDPNHRFGNGIWIKLDSGEVVAYAHTKFHSIPAALCPTESQAQFDTGGDPVHAQPIRVYAGQVIGRVGNTGNTSEPHVHIQLVKNVPFDVDDAGSQSGPALPLAFDSYRTRTRDGLTQANGFSWVDVPEGQGAVLPDRGLLEAHRCGWSPPAPGLIEATMTAVPDACFQDRFDDVVRAGYLPVAIDGYNVGSGVFYNVVFRPGRPATAAFAGLTASAYQAKFDSLAAQGYRLIHVDSFLRSGAVRYAAVWAKEGGPAYVAYHGLTRNQHQKRFDSLTAKGFRPTVISVVAPGGKLRVTALYVKRNVGGFVSVANVKVSKFQAEFNKRTGQGLKPTYVDGYTISGKPYFSVIFTGKASGNYVMRHGMTASKLAARAIQQRGAGRLTVALTGYQSGGAARFAAIWRK